MMENLSINLKPKATNNIITNIKRYILTETNTSDIFEIFNSVLAHIVKLIIFNTIIGVAFPVVVLGRLDIVFAKYFKGAKNLIREETCTKGTTIAKHTEPKLDVSFLLDTDTHTDCFNRGVRQTHFLTRLKATNSTANLRTHIKFGPVAVALTLGEWECATQITVSHICRLPFKWLKLNTSKVFRISGFYINILGCFELKLMYIICTNSVIVAISGTKPEYPSPTRVCRGRVSTRMTIEIWRRFERSMNIAI
mmetsp:Transcript_11/g.16  ORF Transcript_11/g.16 Transcript_11/m.16 type:complete len:252 (-) Transcript_11:110-865(-)